VSQLAEMYHAVTCVIWNVQQCHSYFWLLAFLFVTSQIEQNSFNLTSTNPKMLKMWYVRRAVSGLKVLLFTRTKWVSETGRSQGHVQRGL